jgi:hypothetical protein
VTGRSVAVQGSLAALGLVAAYVTWQREPERAPGEVVVIDAPKNDVTRIRYEDEQNILVVERTKESVGGEPGIALHVEEKPRQEQPAKQGDPMPPPVPPSTPPRDVRGNGDAVKLADRFAPLVSPRAFGVLDAKKLPELGFDDVKRRLEVVVRGETRKYDVGVALHAQNNESFLRDQRDQRIYLMPRGLLGELSNGKRLVDPRLHLFDSKEFDRIVVSAGGKKRELLHQGRDNFSTEGYASVKTPDKRDQMAKNWHDSLWRTFPMEVLGKGEVPKKGTLKPALRVDYFEKGKNVGWIEIARLEGSESASSGESSQNLDLLYARSEHTVGWTHLHAPDQLVTDAEKVAAAP